MPLITVHGLGVREFYNERILAIENTIVWAIESVKELSLKRSDISFSFIKDQTITSDTVDVIIVVDLLFDKPERNFEVRRCLAEKIAFDFKELPGNDNRKIEVFIKRFDPNKDGFACILP